MTAVAGFLYPALLAADRQTIMLRSFWTLVVAAALVSIGAWILLAREVRAQRRGRAVPDVDADADASGDGPEAAGEARSAAEDEGDEPAADPAREDGPVVTAAHAVEIPAGTTDAGEAGDRS